MTIKLINAMRKPRVILANKARARVVVLTVIERFLSVMINDIFNNVSAHRKKIVRRRKISAYETVQQVITL